MTMMMSKHQAQVESSRSSPTSVTAIMNIEGTCSPHYQVHSSPVRPHAFDCKSNLAARILSVADQYPVIHFGKGENSFQPHHIEEQAPFHMTNESMGMNDPAARILAVADQYPLINFEAVQDPYQDTEPFHFEEEPRHPLGAPTRDSTLCLPCT